MSDEELIDYTDPDIIARQNIAPNAGCNIDGKFYDVRNLVHLASSQADRIEALTKERDEADDLAKAAFADGASNNIRLAETAHRVKTLTKERDDYAHKLMQANNTYTEMHLEIERLSDRLAKAVEALGHIAAEASVPVHTWKNGINFKKMYEGWRKIAVERIDIARAALAEIKLQSSEFATQKGESHE